MDKTTYERFAAKVSIGCHVWTGAKHHGGHGVLVVDGKNRLAHRLAYEHAHGPIPHGLVVRHTCDVAACVNPAHLILGTQRQNIDDREERKRTARGSNHYRAKLSEEDVKIIRGSAATGRELSKRYGLSAASISSIRSGTNWKHVPGATARDHRQKLSDGDVASIRASLERRSDLAKRYGVSYETIRNIQLNLSRKDTGP